MSQAAGCSREFVSCDVSRTCAVQGPQRDGALGFEADGANGADARGGTGGAPAGGASTGGGLAALDGGAGPRPLSVAGKASDDEQVYRDASRDAARGSVDGGPLDSGAPDARAPTCDATHADCNGDGRDGCEVEIDADIMNCGACGYACSGANTSQLRCIAGRCAPACLAGHGDCTKSAPAPDDGCETNLSVATDCGACNHGCLGGQCVSGKCQEITIAASLAIPRAVTVAASSVYWIDGGPTDGRVMRASLSGEGAVPIATGQAFPQDIHDDGEFVYWTSSSSSASALRRVNIGGTPVIQDLATSETSTAVASPTAFALDAGHIYWCDGLSYRAFRMPKDGSGGPLELVHSALPGQCRDVQVDSTSVYFALGGWSLVPLDGSAAPRGITSSSGHTSALALDASSLFYRSYDPATLLPAFWKIRRGSSDPADAKMVAAVNPNDFAFTVDASYIYYWSDALYRVAKTGGSPTKLSGNVNNVVRMVIHAEQGGEAIYWVNRGDPNDPTGSVVKLAL